LFHVKKKTLNTQFQTRNLCLSHFFVPNSIALAKLNLPTKQEYNITELFWLRG